MTFYKPIPVHVSYTSKRVLSEKIARGNCYMYTKLDHQEIDALTSKSSFVVQAITDMIEPEFYTKVKSILLWKVSNKKWSMKISLPPYHAMKGIVVQADKTRMLMLGSMFWHKDSLIEHGIMLEENAAINITNHLNSIGKLSFDAKKVLSGGMKYAD